MTSNWSQVQQYRLIIKLLHPLYRWSFSAFFSLCWKKSKEKPIQSLPKTVLYAFFAIFLFPNVSKCKWMVFPSLASSGGNTDCRDCIPLLQKCWRLLWLPGNKGERFQSRDLLVLNLDRIVVFTMQRWQLIGYLNEEESPPFMSVWKLIRNVI